MWLPRRLFFLLPLSMVSCSDIESEQYSNTPKQDSLAAISPCTAELLDGGGWMFGLKPAMPADSFPSLLQLQFPPLLQNLSLNIDTLDVNCPDVMMLNAGFQIQNRKLIKFSITLVFKEKNIANLFGSELIKRMNHITGQNKEEANYNVWQLKRDTDMWQLEARNLAESLGYPALEILMKRAESY